jgi:hypothetical protein
MVFLAVQHLCCSAAYEAAVLPFKENRVTFYEGMVPACPGGHTFDSATRSLTSR